MSDTEFVDGSHQEFGRVNGEQVEGLKKRQGALACLGVARIAQQP